MSGATGHHVGDAGQRRAHNGARLCLPPLVDDRTTLLAYVLVVPQPGIWVDRLARGPQQPQGRQVAIPYRLIGACLLERPYGSGSRVEGGDLLLLYDLEPAVVVRVGGRPLELDGSTAYDQRPVDEVGVAGDPADVRRAPEDVLFLVVQPPHHGGVQLGKVAAYGVQDALGRARRARRVEHEERVLGVHLLGLALVARIAYEIVPVLVAPVFHRHVVARAPHHDHVLHARGVLQSLVGVLLQRRYLTAARGLVGGDKNLGPNVVYPLG